jgi:L,D-transpeptidase ErfK/SrfK
MNAVLPILMLVGQIVGGDWQHTVKPGESLTSIGAFYGVDGRVIAEQNGLAASARLKPDQILTINNRHIVPGNDGAEIIVNVPQRMLFHFAPPGVHGYPIAAGKRSWRTPMGAFSVLTMEVDPVWDVPPSIQEEMRAQGKPVLTRVPAGPTNPLGKYWMATSLPGIGIHSTNAPASIYSLQTHGCIRVHPLNIEDLFGQVRVGSVGRVVYEPVLLAVVNGIVFIEVHADAYGKAPKALDKVRKLAREAGVEDAVDWTKVGDAIRKHDGIAMRVTRLEHSPKGEIVKPSA